MLTINKVGLTIVRLLVNVAEVLITKDKKVTVRKNAALPKRFILRKQSTTLNLSFNNISEKSHRLRKGNFSL